MTSYSFVIEPGNGDPAVYLPLPSQDRGIEMEYMPIGVSGRTADATYRVQHVASKWRVRVAWPMLTEDERATVWAIYGGYIATAMTVHLPNGVSFVGFVDLSSWIELPWFDPHTQRTLYNVGFTFVEA